MWPSRSHFLAPLTTCSGMKKNAVLTWTSKMQDAFDKMRLHMAADTLPAYPDHNKQFDIFTDSSDYQMGACTMQEGHHVAYYSKKLNSAQKNYTTTKREMLSIVSTLKEFRSMLLCAYIHVYTNCKNLTFDDLKTQKVLRWQNKIEEFLPWLDYIEGKKNILADNLSRLLCLPTPSQITEGKKLIEPAFVSEDEDDEDGFLTSCEDSGCFNEEIYNIFECYLNLPEIPDPAQNPLSFSCIHEQQQQDEQLLALQGKYPEQYIYKSLDEDVDDIICYV